MPRLVALLVAGLVLVSAVAAPPEAAPAPRPARVHVAPFPHLPGEPAVVDLDLTLPDIGPDVTLPGRLDPPKPGELRGPPDAVVGLPGLSQGPVQLPFGFGPFEPGG